MSYILFDFLGIVELVIIESSQCKLPLQDKT